MLADDLIRATFSSDEELKSTLLQAIKELGYTVTKFADISGVSSSTLYKLFQENANQISKHSERSSEQLDDSKEPQKKAILLPSSLPGLCLTR